MKNKKHWGNGSSLTLQLKKELISIATHELRTPITGLKGYLDMILAGDTGGVNPATKELLDEMVAINQRLADLVDDLLNVSRIEDGRIEVKPVKMNLNDTITDVVKEMKVQSDQKHLQLIFKPEEEVEVFADPDRLRQVLVNLIGNSIKYTKAGSVEVFIKKGKTVEIHVKDTGIGMSEEQMSRLFEKFYRIKTEATRSITGTGLGLWITKKIVEMMNGTIKVNSVLDSGSDFEFTLPAA